MSERLKQKRKLPFFAFKQCDKEIPLSKKYLRKIDGKEALLLYWKNVNSKASKEELAEYFGLSLRMIRRYCAQILPDLLELLEKKESQP